MYGKLDTGLWFFIEVGFLEQGFDGSSLETHWHNTRVEASIDELHNDRQKNVQVLNNQWINC